MRNKMEIIGKNRGGDIPNNGTRQGVHARRTAINQEIPQAIRRRKGRNDSLS